MKDLYRRLFPYIQVPSLFIQVLEMSCQSHAPVAISTIFNGSPMDVVLGAGATDLFFLQFFESS